MASRDLELLMAPYERALANAHAAGGAIVALKKVARRGIDDDQSLLPPVVVPAGRAATPAGQGRDRHGRLRRRGRADRAAVSRDARGRNAPPSAI